MNWAWMKTLKDDGFLVIKVDLNSWALPMSIYWSDTTKQAQIGPFSILFDNGELL